MSRLIVRKPLRLLMLAGGFLLFISCSYPPWKFDYTGEGEFIDLGSSEPNARYILDLQLDPPSQSQFDFIIGPLPAEQFALGFVGSNLVYDFGRLKRIHRPADPKVRIQLTESESGVTILDASGSIGTWAWGYKVGHPDSVFVHKPNTNSSIPYDGTHFSASNGVQYKLFIHFIDPPSNTLKLSARIKGGGYY